MSENHPVVIVKNISKSFKIPIEGSNGLKQKLINVLKGRKGYRVFTPLSNISFTVNKGDFFGIVGKNGSGKSTLLKTLAGIYQPQAGEVHIDGSLVPFIELGVGFNPELSGRENVYLNGALLGFNHKEVAAMYDEIVGFAELEDFMEERLKNYSSGMQVRLAFSIAIKAEGAILLLDEVLAVGDAAFQQKCFDYFEKLKKQKKTIIIVTHDMNAVKRFCNRAMIISEGKIEKIGNPNEIADLYTEENIEEVIDKETEEEFDTQLEAKLTRKRFKPSDMLEVEVSYTPPPGDDIYFINLSFIFAGKVFADKNTKYFAGNEKNGKSVSSFFFKQPLVNFNSGRYDVCVTIHRKADDRLIKQEPRAATFLIEGYDPSLDGPMKLDGTWSVDEKHRGSEK
jgi:ABC-2 type transport system ATP-binding protein